MAAAAAAIPRVKLGSQGLEVSAQGLGCFGMTEGYGPPKPEDAMIQLLEHAVDSGITFFDIADMYGSHANEVLLGKALKKIGRHRVQVATKFAISNFAHGRFVVRWDPEYVSQCAEASLTRLGVDYIDLYYQHRVDVNVPIEITVGAMKKLVEEGKVKYLGLSEANANTIRRAHAVHPITAVQVEWSLWSRDVENEVVPVCRELGIGIVAYCPLGRGFFSGVNTTNLGADDYRVYGQPRFTPDNFSKNQVLYNRLAEIAKKKGHSPGQLALAWLQHQGADVVPIPGTTKKQNFDHNVAALQLNLTKEDIAEIEDAVPLDQVQGARYHDMSQTMELGDTPPLSSWQ